MKRKPISQREARALRKRVRELEGVLSRERRVWGGEYFGGVPLGGQSWDGDSNLPSAIHAARKLGHAVVVVSNGPRKIDFYALPHPKVPV